MTLLIEKNIIHDDFACINQYGGSEAPGEHRHGVLEGLVMSGRLDAGMLLWEKMWRGCWYVDVLLIHERSVL